MIRQKFLVVAVETAINICYNRDNGIFQRILSRSEVEKKMLSASGGG